MKKLLFFLLTVISMTAAAQTIETLQRVDVPGDELLGTKPMTAWNSEHVTFGTTTIMGITLRSINLHDAPSIFTAPTKTRLGYYTDNDSLVWMINGFMGELSQNAQRVSLTYGYVKDSIEHVKVQKIKGKISYQMKPDSIIKHLENGGYIRIVSPLYDGSLFDVRCRLPRKEQ
jgi:hypothetical protein